MRSTGQGPRQDRNASYHFDAWFFFGVLALLLAMLVTFVIYIVAPT